MNQTLAAPSVVGEIPTLWAALLGFPPSYEVTLKTQVQHHSTARLGDPEIHEAEGGTDGLDRPRSWTRGGGYDRALSPRAREVARKGAVYGLAGVLKVGDVVVGTARGAVRGASEGVGSNGTSKSEATPAEPAGTTDPALAADPVLATEPPLTAEPAGTTDPDLATDEPREAEPVVAPPEPETSKRKASSGGKGSSSASPVPTSGGETTTP